MVSTEILDPPMYLYEGPYGIYIGWYVGSLQVLAGVGPHRGPEGHIKHEDATSHGCFESSSSTPQLPFKRPQRPSNRYQKALSRGTLGGLGSYGASEPG